MKTMRKIIIFTFLALIFVCSCSEKSETELGWINKAQQLWDGKQYTNPTQAAEYLSKAIKLQKNNAETRNNRGTAYYNLGQYQQSIEDYSEAIRIKPDYILAYFNRGNAYAAIGQYQRTIEDYNQVFRMQPNSIETYINRGIVYMHMDKKKLGCDDLQKACKLGSCRMLQEAKIGKLCR